MKFSSPRKPLPRCRGRGAARTRDLRSGRGVLHRVTGPLQRYRAASDWPAKVVALHQGATRVPQKKFSSQNHDLAFAAHVSD